jgi:hypothetical protein
MEPAIDEGTIVAVAKLDDNHVARHGRDAAVERLNSSKEPSVHSRSVDRVIERTSQQTESFWQAQYPIEGQGHAGADHAIIGLWLGPDQTRKLVGEAGAVGRKAVPSSSRTREHSGGYVGRRYAVRRKLVPQELGQDGEWRGLHGLVKLATALRRQ